MDAETTLGIGGSEKGGRSVRESPISLNLVSLVLSTRFYLFSRSRSGPDGMEMRRWIQEMGTRRDKREGGIGICICERAKSQVLDIGCGTGSLLETLVIPPSTIHEPPIRSRKASSSSSSSSSNSVEDEDEDRELFILVRTLMSYPIS